MWEEQSGSGTKKYKDADREAGVGGIMVGQEIRAAGNDVKLSYFQTGLWKGMWCEDAEQQVWGAF